MVILPDANSLLPEHKNADFVLEKPKNEGSRGQKSTPPPILCSGKRELAPGREKISIRKRKVAFLQITAHTFKT